MVPLTVETEVQPDGLVQIRLPDAPEGRKVRVTVEEIGTTKPDLFDLDIELEKLRDDYDARRITQSEFSAAYVELLERYDRANPDTSRKPRVLGRWKDKIEILPGFDDPIAGLEWAYP